MTRKPKLLTRIWRAVVRAVRENGELNERRHELNAKQGSLGTVRRF